MFKLAHFLLYFLVVSSPLVRASYEDPDCDEVISSFDATYTLISMMDHFLAEKLINSQNLQNFLVQLDRGELINPVNHQRTLYGPVFNHSSYQVAYFQFQQYLNEYKKDPQFINLPELKVKIKEVSARLGLGKTEKALVSNQSNIFYFYERLIENKKLMFIFDRRNISTFIEKTPLAMGQLAKYLADSNEEEHRLLATFINQKLKPTESPLATIKKLERTPFDYLKDELLARGQDDFEKTLLYLMKTSTNNREKYFEWAAETKSQAIIEKAKKVLFFYSSNAYQDSLLINFLMLNHELEHVEKDLTKLYGHLIETKEYERAYYISKLPISKDPAVFLEDHRKLFLSWELYNPEATIGKSSEEDYLKSIKLALVSDQASNRIAASRALGYFHYTYPQNKEAMELILGFWKPENKNAIEEKLRNLMGIDEDWALEILEKSMKTYDYNRTAFYEAVRGLGGRSSLKSRKFIETYGELYPQWDFEKAFIGRPKNDLLYFVRNHKNFKTNLPGIALKFLDSVYHDQSLEVIKLAQEMAYSQKNQTYAFDYLDKLPLEPQIDFWKKIAQEQDPALSRVRYQAIEKLLGQDGPEFIAIFELMQSSAQEYGKSKALPSLIFAYFSLIEKALMEKTELKGIKLELLEDKK